MPRPALPEKKIEWEDKLRKQRESGLSIERWCHENQIPKHTFYYWRDKLHPKTPLNHSCFTELKDVKGAGITLEYRDICIRLDQHFEPSILKRCLAVLMEIKC